MKRDTFIIDGDNVRLKVFRIGSSAELPPRASGNAIGMAHTHFTYEIFFVTEGHLKLITGEGSAEFEGAAVIIPPRLGHYSVPERRGSYCFLFSFEERGGELEERLGDRLSAIPLTEDDIFYIKRAVARLDEGTASSERDAELLLALLLRSVLRRLTGESTVQSAKSGETKHINEIERMINERIKDGISLTELSRGVYLSRRQVSRIISKEYGCSLPRLINEKRLAAAEVLVRNSGDSMTRIAEKVGIRSEGYFYTLFKARYGMTPLQYRKKHR